MEVKYHNPTVLLLITPESKLEHGGVGSFLYNIESIYKYLYLMITIMIFFLFIYY